MYSINEVERACCALNSPEKCFTLALLDGGTDLYVDEIRDRYNLLHGKSSHTPEYKSATEIDRWMGYSLVPCLLAEELSETPKIFKITQFGREIGVPLAGHLMALTSDYLLEYGYDLEDIIGVNKPLRAQDSGSIRTPMRRIAFGRALITTPNLPVQQIRLENDILALGEEYAGGFDRTLSVLDKVGAIVYSSGRKDAIREMEKEGRTGKKEFVKYRLGNKLLDGDENFTDGISRVLAEDIYLYFKSNSEEELHVSELADRLIQNLDKYFHYGNDEDSRNILIERLANHLPAMANLDLLLKSKYHGLYQSEIDLTTFGRAVFGEIIKILDLASDPTREFLEAGRNYLIKVMSSESKVLQFLGK